MTCPEIAAARRVLAVSLFVIVAIAAATLDLLPIADPTEGRYAEIARTMADSGDWVTPRLWIDGEHVAYLGKPPLQFWAAAASLRVFGVSRWAVRLPNLLGGIALVLLAVWFGQRRFGGCVGWLAGVILASSVLWQLLAGASTLATTLAVTVAIQLVAFYEATGETGRRRVAGLVFFAGAGLAALAKGPIGLVLPGLALVLWMAVTREWSRIRRLPWWSGLAVFALIATPWYVLAERANPGFLEYFFYHEHVLRFLEPEYGDRYGRGHTYPYGTIWLMLVAVLWPWSIALVSGLWSRVRDGAVGARRFVLAWGLAPALFFTVARNVSPSYLLPGFAGLTLFIAASLPERPARRVLVLLALPPLTAGALAVAAVGLDPSAGDAWFLSSTWIAVLGGAAVGAALVGWWMRTRATVAGIIGLVGVSTAIVFAITGGALRSSLRVRGSSEAVLARCRAIDSERPVLFLHSTPASANFYAPDRLEHLAGERTRGHWLIPPAHPLIVYRKHRVDRILPAVLRRLHPVERLGSWVICRVR